MLPMCHATRDPPKTDPVRASDSVLGGGSSKVLAATRTARLRSVAPLGGVKITQLVRISIFRGSAHLALGRVRYNTPSR